MYFKDRTGEISFSTSGEKMEIVAYRKFNDIDVKFEDGSIAKKQNFKNFKLGNISNPSFYKKKYLGLEIKASNGMKMKIIDYRTMNDFDVQFEDGIIVKHKSWGAFKRGQIEHPNKWENFINNKIGLKSKAKNGQEIEIIAYRRSLDMDVKFEDGYIAKGVSFANFKKGEIKNPYFSKVGEISKAHSIGGNIKLIAYRSAADVDVEFEDGSIVKNRTYEMFKTGRIKHPYIKKNGMQTPQFQINSIFGIQVFDKYYHCKCSKCELNTVMTFKEAKEHKC